MAERLGTAVLELTADGSQLDRDVEQAQTSVQQKLDRAGRSMMRTGTRLTAAVTAPLIGLGAVAFNAASDLNEAVSLVDRTYGDNAAAVQEWSQTTADRIGIARDAALQATGTFGLMFKEMGFGESQAADMSTSIVELSGDMASAFNAEPVEMLQALRSGLTGEIEPLRRFGILLNAAEVEAKAMEMGLADANGEISEGAKVNARYQLILEKTSGVQGDFAATADQAANRQRIAKAEFRDAAATLGQQLVPAATALIEKITSIARWFSDLSPTTQKVIVVVAALAAVLGPLLIVVGAVASALAALATVQLAALAPWLLAAAAIAAVVAIGWLLVKNWDKITAWLSSTWSKITAWTSSTWQTITSTISRSVDRIVGWFRALPGRALNALAGFATAVVAFIARWHPVAVLLRAVNAAWPGLSSWLRGLPRRIVSSIGNMGRLLYSAGRDLIRGLIGGITNMARAAARAARNVASSAVSGVKRFLGIGSPSKVFMEIGANLTESMGLGISKVRDVPAHELAGVTNRLRDPVARTNLGGVDSDRPLQITLRVSGSTMAEQMLQQWLHDGILEVEASRS